DRDIDKHVKRTRERPITSGQVAPKEALILAAGLAFVALLLVLTLNTLTLLLSIPAILLAASYPYTKRFLAIPQAYLGVAFSFGIPMAFAAQLNTVPAVAWWLVLANLFWVIAYDTEYAMVDRDDDIHLGIHSSALLFGKYDVVAVMICYGATLNILVMVGQMLEKGWIYYVGLAVATAIAVYHFTLIQHRKREDCFKAFLHNTWFGMAIFGGILWDYGR
ncbi:MAG: 4-hydroxybenzoate octaprenyltransferase, partial [Candidatus Nitrotoga sp.]